MTHLYVLLIKMAETKRDKAETRGTGFVKGAYPNLDHPLNNTNYLSPLYPSQNPPLKANPFQANTPPPPLKAFPPKAYSFVHPSSSDLPSIHPILCKLFLLGVCLRKSILV